MEYRYRETIDWGIIKREWLGEEADYSVILEQHEEGRFTVEIKERNGWEYYSYWKASGQVTYATLEEAQLAAEEKIRQHQDAVEKGFRGGSL